MKKTRIIVALIALVCAFSLVALPACSGGGGSQKEATPDDDVALITADIENVIGTSITGEEIAAGFREDAEFMELVELTGIDVDLYADSMAEALTCEVASVEVNGDTAVATLKVTAPDYDAMYSNLDGLLDERLEGVDVSVMTEDEVYKLIGEILMETATDPNMPKKTSNVEVNYTKVNGTWTIDDIDAVTNALYAAMAE